MSPNNDPFGDIDRQRDEAAGNSSSGNSWENVPQARHRKKKGSKVALWIIIALCAGVLILCCICCGGLYSIGTSEYEREAEERLRDNPVILEHIGEIESCEYNLLETVDDEGAESHLFDIKGSKGSGKVRIVTDEFGNDEMESGVLILPDGTEIDLELEDDELFELEPFEEEASDAAGGINDPPEAIPDGNDTGPDPDQQ